MSRSRCTLDESFTKGKQAENAENQRFFTEKPSIYEVFRLPPPYLGTLPLEYSQGGHPTSIFFHIIKIFMKMDNSSPSINY